MPNIKVSTVTEVLELLRKDVVASLRMAGFRLPPEVDQPGMHYEAVSAWVRLQHRSVAKTPRLVRISNELSQRSLEGTLKEALSVIQSEFERGDDLTHRLSRQFYKSDFNDFLFNAFGIHHVHLGTPNTGIDKTKQHPMAGGGEKLLFVMIESGEVAFLDVLGHDVFDSPELSKHLVQVTRRNWPQLLKRYIVPGVLSAEMTFEEAFRLHKAGFGTMFELDGAFFMLGGTVLDGKVTAGKRASCTSTEVVTASNRIVNRVARLVEYIEREASRLSELVEVRTGRKPSYLELEVIRAGTVAVVRDRGTGTAFFHDGEVFGVLHGQ